MKKEITIQPYLKDMTYDENAWLIIDCKTGDIPYVNFYNSKQDPDKEFETLKDFAQYYIENEFKKFANGNTEYKEKNITASGCNIIEGGDYDEETGRSWKTKDPDGQLIEVMTNVKLENIPTEITKLKNELINIEKDTLETDAEVTAERKDPYGYRGLSKSDFM